MQKKEEEMRKLNKTIMDDEQYVILSPEDDTTITSTKEEGNNNEQATSSSSFSKERESSSLPPMNQETAKELDEAVRLRFSSAVGSETIPLELPQLYKVLSMDNHDNTKDDDNNNYKDQDNTINLDQIGYIREKLHERWYEGTHGKTSLPDVVHARLVPPPKEEVQTTVFLEFRKKCQEVCGVLNWITRKQDQIWPVLCPW